MIPGLGFQEIFLLAVAALIFVGPKDLPVLMRRAGQWVGKGRVMANELRAAFDDIARQTELDEMKKEIAALRQNNAIRVTADEFAQTEREINAAVMRGTSLKDTNALKPNTSPASNDARNAHADDDAPTTPTKDTAEKSGSA